MFRVHSYESMGTLDGPGLRLVVFLQGCPFRCLYCANPDTIDPIGESTLTDEDEILRMAIDQKPFFGKRGGITFSGGEPTVQARQLIPLFERLREAGINIALDTNGAIISPEVDRLHSLTDLVLLDVKQINADKHRSLTGLSNENTLLTAERLRDKGIRVWLRYVLVPGISNDPADMRQWAQHFSEFNNIERVELLPYHTLGRHKYDAMGLKYALENTLLNTPAQVNAARELLAGYFTCPVISN
ncbi:MAG: pyruvate formate-lyase-activating protein [Bacteroides sp.]|nr:pyruvate formate-lyase-activating protein [Bacteroides sp.]MCM1379383.1 pyruvate formate-lyase-activating protein [Bacteroides sp.]MCM1445243.1 pyruvate formate-lyase-activating protein [Prevotella sp.]